MVEGWSASYIDQDSDGLGEYLYLGELAGNPLGPRLGERYDFRLSILSAEWRDQKPTVNNVQYHQYLCVNGEWVLPPKEGELRTFLPASAPCVNHQEAHYIIFALPVDKQMTYCLTDDGRIWMKSGGEENISPDDYTSLSYSEWRRDWELLNGEDYNSESWRPPVRGLQGAN